MKNDIISPEQFARYEAIIAEYDRFRRLSQEEKEDLIIRIATSTYIDLLCDWAFKHVFGHNEQNLMLLLNDILPEKIVHIDYEPNEIDLWKGDDKKVIMDVVCFMNFRLQHDIDKLIYTYQLRETTGEGYTRRSILNLYLCELPRFAGDPGNANGPIEVWFDILQNMSNFASKPERYGSRYDSIFESSRQSPIPDQDKLQYFRSMFNDDVRSYLTDEDRKEIAEEYYAKGIEQGLAKGREEEKIETARRFKNLGVPAETISTATGLSTEAIAAL